MEYTVAELAKALQVKPRTIQLWADFGILEPIGGTQGAGTGVHRRFDTAEARVAAVLVHLASNGVPRGVLKQTAERFRDALSPSRPKSGLLAPARRLREAAERAVQGRGLNFLHYITNGGILGYDVITDEDGDPVLNSGLIRSRDYWGAAGRHKWESSTLM